MREKFCIACAPKQKKPRYILSSLWCNKHGTSNETFSPCKLKFRLLFKLAMLSLASSIVLPLAVVYLHSAKRGRRPTFLKGGKKRKFAQITIKCTAGWPVNKKLKNNINRGWVTSLFHCHNTISSVHYFSTHNSLIFKSLI